MTVCAWEIVAKEIGSVLGIVSVSVRVSDVRCDLLRASYRLPLLVFQAARNHEALHQSPRLDSNQSLLELARTLLGLSLVPCVIMVTPVPLNNASPRWDNRLGPTLPFCSP